MEGGSVGESGAGEWRGKGGGTTGLRKPQSRFLSTACLPSWQLSPSQHWPWLERYQVVQQVGPPWLDRRWGREGPTWGLQEPLAQEGVKRGPFCATTGVPFPKSRLHVRSHLNGFQIQTWLLPHFKPIGEHPCINIGRNVLSSMKAPHHRPECLNNGVTR